MVDNNSNDKGLKQDREKKWEKAQIKAFKSWMNSYLEKRGLIIEDVTQDLKDGVRLISFLELVKGIKMKGWHNPAKMRIHHIENANIALNFIQKELGVRLVGVGAEDVCDGNVKLTLGVLWSLFKKIRIESINAEGESSEDKLLTWLRQMTNGYDGVDITDFRESFRDGMAFSALIHKFKPEAIDFENLDPNNAEQNLINAFKIAEEQLGIPQLLDVEDLLDGTVDERSLVLYNSLFFHAYVADEERRKEIEKREAEKKEQEAKMQGQVAELHEKIKQLTEENESLKELTKQLESTVKEVQVTLEKEKEEKSQLVEQKSQLEEEKSQLAEQKSQLEEEKSQLVEEKTQLVEEKTQLAEEQSQLKEETNSNVKELEEKIEHLTEEIIFLKKREIMDSELRELLENKVGTLELLLEEKFEENINILNEKESINAEIDGIKSDREKLNEKLESIEEERNNLLTDAEEKQRRLHDMEQKKSNLMDQIKKLQERVKKEIERQQEKVREIEKLKKQVQVFESKQIVETKARVGLDVLKKNLEDHLEDLYRWRDINDEEFKDNVEEFDLGRVISDISMKNFQEQLDYLDEKLQEENRALQRIIKCKDDEKELKEVVIKEGWLTMKGRKEWKKRWFKLTGSRLTYFEDEDSEDISGCIQLDKNCDVVRQKAVKEDQNSNKKAWPLKITVGERKLFVRAQTKKERHTWFLVLTSSIAHLSYTQYCETNNLRPDTRVLTLFDSDKSPAFNFCGRDINEGAISSLVKGLPGRDELEDFTISNANLDDKLLEKLGTILEKLNIQNVDFSNNKLSSASVPWIIKGLGNSIVSVKLNNNLIDDEGISALCEHLSSCPNLSILDLSNNKINDNGCKAISQLLASDSVNIPSVQLSNNNISDEGAEALAELLATDKKINSLNLCCNSVGDSGATALAKALTENTTLNSVNLSNNNIGATGALAIRDLLSSNKDINTFNISNNSNLKSGNELNEFLNVSGYSLSSLVFSRNI